MSSSTSRFNYLHESFVPTPYTVIMGRGNTCSNNVGNRRLRIVINLYTNQYVKAKSKVERSSIVSSIMDIFAENCCNGGGSRCCSNDGSGRTGPSAPAAACGGGGAAGAGACAAFVKYDSSCGRYYVVDETIARERIGSMLRDVLHTHYKSSNKAKRERRRR